MFGTFVLCFCCFFIITSSNKVPVGTEDVDVEDNMDLLEGSLDLPFSSEHLPVFLEEPVDTYAMKNKPAVLYCRSAHALQVYFKCSGDTYHRQLPQQVFVDPETGVRVVEASINITRNMVEEYFGKDMFQCQCVAWSSRGEVYFKCSGDTYHRQLPQQVFVDPETGVRVVEASINITRNMVEEYFGKDRFQCQCVAWSSRGEVESQPATIENAYLQKQFLAVPDPDRVEVGHQVQLRCLPPSGVPLPSVRWLRDNEPLLPDANVIVSSEGHLLIGQARLQDSANYTCAAENIAAKRVTRPVQLLVFANGGWSGWTEWSDCPLHSCDVQQSRYRLCNKPPPQHGLPCAGPSVETRECMDPHLCIVVDGRWSPWSEWSQCDQECKQYRARNCSSPAPSHGGRPCEGEGVQVVSCVSGLCKVTKSKLPADLAMYTGFVVAVCVFTLVLLVIVFAVYYKRQRCTVHTAVVSDYYSGDEKSGSQPDVTKTVLYVYSDSAKQYMLPHSDSIHHYDVPHSSSHWIVGNKLEEFENLKTSRDYNLMSTFDHQKFAV